MTISWRHLLRKLSPDERWQDLLLPGQADQIEAALWFAASLGVDGAEIARAIEKTIEKRTGDAL